MPPRKAAKTAPPAPKPFEGFKLAISGKFQSIGYTQSALESLVKELGGTVGSRVDASTTHLVCTEDDFEAKSAKVTGAQAKDLPILKVDWLLDCSNDKKGHDVDDYLLSSKSQNGTASTANTQTNGAAVPVRGKKRKADDDNGTAQKVEPAKKKAADDKKAAKAEEEEEEETKEVAEGQFIKKKGVVIPLDEHCPNQDRTVYIDPDSGMIYDASLNQSNSSHNNNKFYRVQVCSHRTYLRRVHELILYVF